MSGYIAEPHNASDPVVRESSVLDQLRLNDTGLVETVTIQSLDGTIEVVSTTIGSDSLVLTSAMQAALSGKLDSSLTKAELNTAVSDGNVVYVGDGLNGTLGADTPSTVAATTVSISGLTVGRIPYVGTSNILSNSTNGPYWDNSNNEMRVGTNSATYGSFGNGTGIFHARADSGVASKIRVSTAGNQSWLAFDRCNGTVASQTALASGDILGSVVGVGCYGSSTAYVHGPQIDLRATQAWTVSANGCGMKFNGILNGTTSQVTFLSINDDGAGATVLSNGRFAINGLWQFNTDGRFLALADNSYDIGFSSSGFRPRTIFAGTLVTAPSMSVVTAYRFSSTANTDGSASAQITQPSAGVVSIDTTAAGNALGSLACANITASGAVVVNSSSQHVINNGSNQFFVQVTGSIVRLGSYNGTGLPLSINGSGGPVLIGTEAAFSGVPRLGILAESAAQTTLGLKGSASYTGTYFECRDSSNGLKYKIDSSGNVTSGSIAIGSGTAILKVLSATATLDFGSIAANSYADLTITVTGAAVGDDTSIGVPNGSLLADLVFFAWVSATNTVTVRCANNSSTTARDPASGTFRATVTQF